MGFIIGSPLRNTLLFEPYKCCDPSSTISDEGRGAMISAFGTSTTVNDLPLANPLTRDVSLFIDFDGTLAGIASLPPRVLAPAYLPDLLLRTRSALNGALGIISNRTLRDIDRLTKWTVPAVAGVHGLERRTAENLVTEHDPRREFLLDKVRNELQVLLELHPNVNVEDKGVAIALHYEGCPSAREDCLMFARSFVLADAISGAWEISMIEAHCGIELTLGTSSKAVAIREFMQEAPFRGRVPIVIGHDLSSEEIFREAQGLGGTAIIVGPRRPTAANFALPDSRAVHEWLWAVHKAK